VTPSAWLLVSAVFGAAIVLWRRTGLNFSLASVLLGLMIFFHGAAYLYYTRIYGPETYFFDVIMSAVGNADVLTTLDLALALAFAFVCLGIAFTDRALGMTQRRWRRALATWAKSPVVVNRSDVQRITLICVVLVLGVLLPFVFIDAQIPKVLEYAISDLGEFEKIALRREGGGSSVYLYNLLLSTLLPFVSFCLIGLLFAKASVPKVLSFSFIALVALGKAATLSKAPLAIFALQCAIVWLMLHKLTPSLRASAAMLILATALFIAMAWVADPSQEGLWAVLDFLFYRVFMIVNESLLEYFAAIPYVIEHSWGAQFSWIATLFQLEPRLPTYWLVGEAHRGVMGSTTTVMFVGDAWADFAWLGVILAAFLGGALTRWIDIRLIVRQQKSVLSVAGIALGHFGVFIALSTALQTALVTGGLLFVIPFVEVLSRRRVSFDGAVQSFRSEGVSRP